MMRLQRDESGGEVDFVYRRFIHTVGCIVEILRASLALIAWWDPP